MFSLSPGFPHSATTRSLKQLTGQSTSSQWAVCSDLRVRRLAHVRTTSSCHLSTQISDLLVWPQAANLGQALSLPGGELDSEGDPALQSVIWSYGLSLLRICGNTHDEMLGGKKRYNFNTVQKSTQKHILSDPPGTILSASDMLIHSLLLIA